MTSAVSSFLRALSLVSFLQLNPQIRAGKKLTIDIFLVAPMFLADFLYPEPGLGLFLLLIVYQPDVLDAFELHCIVLIILKDQLNPFPVNKITVNTV